MGGDASSAGGSRIDAGAGGGGAVGTLGQPCAPTGAYACAGYAQRGQLVCSNGVWATNGTCPAGNYCDTRPSEAGFCSPVVPECSGKKPGDSLCMGQNHVRCGPDLVTTTDDPCVAQTCVGDACVGVCTVADTRCSNNGVETCNDKGQWGTAVPCVNQACPAGSAACQGVCAPGSKQCSGNNPELCSDQGAWTRSGVGCAAGEVCIGGTCAKSPSCAGLAANCGPSSGDSCCASSVVAGGTFYRSFDGVGFTDQSHPATVSDFRLDKYEVTVGRFRVFLDAGNGISGNPPASGAGANPNITGSGWAALWYTYLKASAAELRTALVSACDVPGRATWTDSPGANERKPIVCVSWYEAFAFCAWDGGRLPTETEWNYAASGGSEQRVYPWSTPPSSTVITPAYAVYNASIANVGSTSPLGDGRWGHSDLSGNVFEYALDAYSPTYVNPCTNCAFLSTANVDRTDRGGSFNVGYPYISASQRSSWPASNRAGDLGIRCARAP